MKISSFGISCYLINNFKRFLLSFIWREFGINFSHNFGDFIVLVLCLYFLPGGNCKSRTRVCDRFCSDVSSLKHPKICLEETATEIRVIVGSEMQVDSTDIWTFTSVVCVCVCRCDSHLILFVLE